MPFARIHLRVYILARNIPNVFGSCEKNRFDEVIHHTPIENLFCYIHNKYEHVKRLLIKKILDMDSKAVRTFDENFLLKIF